MNILMFNTNNPRKTAGNVALDLFLEFRKQGHRAVLMVNEADPGYPEGIINMKSAWRAFRERMTGKIRRRLGLNRVIVSDPDFHFQELQEDKMFYSTGDLLKKAGIQPDVIVLFFAKNFINTRNIFELHQRTGAPVFWLIYDMAPMTGGCHYAWDCTGYQHSCGACPGLFSSDPKDLTWRNLQYKKSYLDKTDLRIVSGAEWQYRQVKKSTLFKDHIVHKILNGINSKVFCPADKQKVRNEIGIPGDKKVIFFGAVYLDHKRKGFDYLFESLDILKKLLRENGKDENEVLLLVAGQEFGRIRNRLPFAYHYMGMLESSEEIASAYQAADLFVCPSIEESGPTMVNQSVMCGTPVVAFEMGVSLDLVITGKTGYLATLRDSNDLARGMFRVLEMNKDEQQTMQHNCRQLALELFHPDVNNASWKRIITGAVEPAKVMA